MTIATKETASIYYSGAVNANGFNWEKEIQFSPVEDQYFSLTMGVGLRKISEKGITEISGNDALDFLNRISTNDIKNLAKNSYARTVFTTEKGRIIDSVGVLNFGDFLLLAGSIVYQPKVASWINKYIILDDVKVSPYDNKFYIFELLGPQADSFIRLIVGNEINKIEVNQFKEFFVDEMHFHLLKLEDAEGNYFFRIVAALAYGKKIISFMQENKGCFDFNLIGETVYEQFRIQRGIPKAPNEFNDLYNPMEVNLKDEISFTKGCYIGQEVIARLDTYDKVQRTLCGVVFEDEINPEQKFQLFNSIGEPVGEITSIAKSLVHDKMIGLAVIRKQYFNPGETLEAKTENKSVNVKLIKTPFKK